MHLNLTILPEKIAVCKFQSNSEIPAWALNSTFYSITKTKEELSIVCLEDQLEGDEQVERGWKAIKVEGPLDFSLIGILANLSSILASGKISIFVISTFDTDYILVKEDQLEKAQQLLSKSGHTIKS